MIKKIVSGGQTGVDRGALLLARTIGLESGGWCPRNRRAEDGRIDADFPLQETPLHHYWQRTQWNVRDSDGTMLLHRGKISRGTALTWRTTKELDKPCCLVDMNQPVVASRILKWLDHFRIEILNVAGPRESENPGIQEQAFQMLGRILNVGEGLSPP